MRKGYILLMVIKLYFWDIFKGCHLRWWPRIMGRDTDRGERFLESGPERDEIVCGLTMPAQQARLPERRVHLNQRGRDQ